ENAIRYSENDSQIWLSTSVVDSQVKISVRDEGIGIPPDLIGNIFDLFCQGESTIHRTSGGMGVGLFLVKHIVDAHDGVIDVHSAGTDLGSRFDIRIPQSTKSQATAPAVSTPDFELLSIVIVEDNSDARKMTSQLLELQGFEVIQFSDGESACQEIPILCPDVAIIDIGLPGKSGLDLAREFRKNKNLENTILVALTGYGRESDQQETTAAGFDLHFVKPTSIEDLTHAIGTWAQKNRNDLPIKTFRPNRKGMQEMSATASSLLKSDQQG
ncbi:MAG: CheY-like chemotaxis protein, partial [Mariniblastus sp.]